MFVSILCTFPRLILAFCISIRIDMFILLYLYSTYTLLKFLCIGILLICKVLRQDESELLSVLRFLLRRARHNAKLHRASFRQELFILCHSVLACTRKRLVVLGDRVVQVVENGGDDEFGGGAVGVHGLHHVVGCYDAFCGAPGVVVCRHRN